MPANSGGIPTAASASASRPAAKAEEEQSGVEAESGAKSALTPNDMAAMESMFAALDDNFKTSYDLSQMSAQVFTNCIYMYAAGCML